MITTLLYLKRNTLWDKVYILNLKRRKDKLEHTIHELRKNFITNYTVVHGIDGLYLPKQDKLIEKKILHKNFSTHKWVAQKKGAIGNYLSFIQIYQDIIKNKIGTSLILEDDILIQPQFWKVLHSIETLDISWDLIYLGVSNLTIHDTFKHWRFIKSLTDEHSLYKPYSPHGNIYGNFGLLIKSTVAHKWLDKCLPITQASDARLGSFVTGRKISVDKPFEIESSDITLKGFVVFPPIIKYTFKVSDTNNII